VVDLYKVFKSRKLEVVYRFQVISRNVYQVVHSEPGQFIGLGLITRRSQVRVLAPLLKEKRRSPGLRFFRSFTVYNSPFSLEKENLS